MNDNNSLAHTTWNCKYHIVFAPKYRRKIFYGEHKEEMFSFSFSQMQLFIFCRQDGFCFDVAHQTISLMTFSATP